MPKIEPVATAAGSPSRSNLKILDSISRVVAAFATREAATVDEVVELAQRLTEAYSDATELSGGSHQNISNIVKTERTTSEVFAKPAVSIENCVTADTVFCLCCGRGFTMLKRHLKAEHGLTEEKYRTQFGLPDDFPLVAPNYSERKAAYAKQVGLGKYGQNRQPQIPLDLRGNRQSIAQFLT